MKRAAGIILLALFFSNQSQANSEISEYYGAGLCAKPNYKCIKVQRNESWQKLFPNEEQRDLVQRLNRSDTYLYSGKVLAVPANLDKVNLFDVSPFPLKIKAPNEKLIMVNQDLLAWGAYESNGQLVKWGPISSGRDYCSDIKRSCKTITGIYYVFNKKDAKCRSNIFPVGRGGSEMPYCMFFYKGYALHGSNEVKGYRDSHGCVRLFTRDAKWLNENFIDVTNTKENHGTKLIVQKITTENVELKKKVAKK